MKPKKKPPRGFILHRVTMILQNVPRDVRDGFKAYCARRGLSMKERIIELMMGDINAEIKTVQRSAILRKESQNSGDV